MRLIWTCSKFTLVQPMINRRNLMLFQIQRKDRIQIDARVMISVPNHIIKAQCIKDQSVVNSLEKVSKTWNKHKQSEFITNLSTQINNLKLISMLISINLRTEHSLYSKHRRTLIIEQCQSHQKLSKNETKIWRVSSLRIFLKQWCNTIIQLLLVILRNIHHSHFNHHRLVEETRKERMLMLKLHLQCPRQQCLMESLA